MKLTHVRLLVEDTERCLAFYRDALGLEVTLEAGDGIYYELAAGDVLLALYRRDLMGQMMGAELPPPAQSDAVAFTFQVHDVDQTCEELRGRGVELVTEPMDYDVAFLRLAHLRDPEGNLIEINAPLSAPTI
ncbi:MAG TPA: VOC family protein [Actinomycetota bacterium]|nr:VOC family protein [Actinomycetota bacterium]